MFNFKNKKGEISFLNIVATIGAVLIFVGVAWLIAINWESIPNVLKTLILVLATFLTFSIGIYMRMQDYEKIGRSLEVLGSLLYTLTIFLIAQIYNIVNSVQGYANLLLLALIGVIAVAYILKSPESLVVGLIEFLGWINLQFFALALSAKNIMPFSTSVYAFLLLSSAVFVYGLSLWHRVWDNQFTRIYEFWTVFYALCLAYVLSFQVIIPRLWEEGISFNSQTIFFGVFLIISLMVFFSGAFYAINKNTIKNLELLAVLGFIIIFTILIMISGLTTGLMGICSAKSCYDLNTMNECNNAPVNLYCEWEGSRCDNIRCSDFETKEECSNAPADLNCNWVNYTASERCSGEGSYELRRQNSDICSQHNNEKKACEINNLCKWRPTTSIYGRRGNAPFIIWFVWIIVNIFFILFILSVIGFGTLRGSTKIVNLGLVFFVLDIITRYIGFMIDFWGYTSMAFLSIIGGILLIVLAWGVTKWRKKLISEVKETKKAR